MAPDRHGQGHVRRPLPLAKALDDALLAYEMNGQALPPDHGFPLRLVVPGWVGVASVKWVGQIQVSTQPLFSPWSTIQYRLFGPSYPPRGGAAHPPAGQERLRAGLGGGVAGGRASGPAGPLLVWPRPDPAGRGEQGRRCQLAAGAPAAAEPAQCLGALGAAMDPPAPGRVELLAHATDRGGLTQPARVPFNDLGYAFWAVVRHPVTVVPPPAT
jgi:hypothetical protein